MRRYVEIWSRLIPPRRTYGERFAVRTSVPSASKFSPPSVATHSNATCHSDWSFNPHLPLLYSGHRTTHTLSCLTSFHGLCPFFHPFTSPCILLYLVIRFPQRQQWQQWSLSRHSEAFFFSKAFFLLGFEGSFFHGANKDLSLNKVKGRWFNRIRFLSVPWSCVVRTL